jgi:glycosyltransferase involved in cell wall biosynthesis
MKKRNVHVITKYFYPVAAGIENNIMQTYSPMAEKGWDITVHTTKDTYDKSGSLSEFEEINGMKIRRYKWNPTIGFWPLINWDKADFICLHNFNIVPHVYILFFSSLLKVFGKKRFGLFITPHGGYSPEWRTFSPFATLIKKIYHWYISIPLINFSVDGIRAVSDWEKEEMVDSGIKEEIIKVIKNGLEDEAYEDIDRLATNKIRKKVKKLGTYIIQIGRVYQIKNQEAVIKALPKIDKEVKFVIVGPCQDEKYKKHIKKIAKKMGVKNRVKYLGVIRGIDKYYLLKHAKAMVHMALWEGNCNVVHEAWSQNVVCIVANSKGLNEQIKENVNGFLVNEDDVNKLAKRVNYVLNNGSSKKLNDFRKKNQKYVKFNSWKSVSREVGNFYLERGKMYEKN